MKKVESSKRILLINPPVHDFAAYDFWAKPSGLLVIADALREKGALPVLVDAMDPRHPMLDGLRPPIRRADGRGKFFAEHIAKPDCLKDVPRRFKRYGLPPDRLKKAIRAAGPVEAVLVTCVMTYWYPGAFEAIAAAKDVFPSVPVILGGTYATLCEDHARKYSGADYVLPGRVEQSKQFADITGFDLNDKTLFPLAMDLYEKPDYAPVLTSRGCPYRCDYCASKLLFPVYTPRDPDEVVEEIGRARKRGVVDFAFYDDALAVSRETRLIPILEEVLRRGWNLRFHSPNAMHVRGIDDDLAILMRRAGFVTVRLGVETTEAACERRDNKMDPDSLPGVAEAFLKAGWEKGQIGAYVLVGIPGQTVEQVEKDINVLWKLGIRPYLAEYSPIPGTKMFEEAVEISRYKLETEPLTQNNSTLPCASESFTLDDLQKMKENSWPKKNK